MGPRAPRRGDERTWLLIKHRDDWAGDVDVTTAAPDSVKSFGDFADILAAEKPDVWESHKPQDGKSFTAHGGETGKMFEKILKKAANIRAKRSQNRPGSGRAVDPSGARTRT